MKKMSETVTYSECECPFCGGYIHYDQLYQQHYNYDIYEVAFKYCCPHCHKEISVKVEFTPNYTLSVMPKSGTDSC